MLKALGNKNNTGKAGENKNKKRRSLLLCAYVLSLWAQRRVAALSAMLCIALVARLAFLANEYV